MATTSNDESETGPTVDDTPSGPPSSGRDLTAPAQPEPWRPSGTSGTSAASMVTKGTRTSGMWIAVLVASVVLIFLLVFILQNLASVTVRFLGFSGTLPLGVAMLFAAIAGALLIALVGAARILQLRRRVRRIGAR